MKFQEIQRMAKGTGINTFRMKKTDIIRSIQRREKISTAIAPRG